MKTTTKLLILDSTLHGIIDFLSITTLLNMLLVSQSDAFLTLVVYSVYIVIAFLSQPIVGYLFDIDAYDENAPNFAKIAGTTTIVLSMLVCAIVLFINANANQLTIQTIPGGQYTIISITMVAATCNCTFHVFGGRRTYQHANGKALPFAVFIAPGGIGFGSSALINTIDITSTYIPIITIAIIACVLGIIVIKTDIGNLGDTTTIQAKPITIQPTDIPLIMLLIIGMISNGVAAYAITTAISSDVDITRITEQAGLLIPIITVAAIAALKICGGVIQDKTSICTTLMISFFCVVISATALYLINNILVITHPANLNATLILTFLTISSISTYILIPVRSYFTWTLFNKTPGFAFGIGGFAIGASAIVYTLIQHNLIATPFATQELNIAIMCITVGQAILLSALTANAIRFKLFKSPQESKPQTEDKS